MKSLLLYLISGISMISFSQGYPPIEDGGESIESVADNITDQYDEELSMTYKEKQLFKTTVEDFLILRQGILDTKEGKAQLNALKNLQAEETLRVKNILRQPQIDLYLKLKPKIQPLKIVDIEKED